MSPSNKAGFISLESARTQKPCPEEQFNFIKLTSIYLDTNVTILRFITAPFTAIIIQASARPVRGAYKKYESFRHRSDHRNVIIHTCQCFRLLHLARLPACDVACSRFHGTRAMP